MASQRIWTSEDLKELGFEPEVHRITSAETRQSVDVDHRFKSYAIKMAIRVICIVAALFTDGWVQIALIIGAAVIPWVAVVAANGANRQPRADFSRYLPEEQRLMLEEAKNPTDPDDQDHQVFEDAPMIIEGEIVAEDES